MHTFGNLGISVANDATEDSMCVILHEFDEPLIEGVISGDRANNQRRVVFYTPIGKRTFPFEETREALLRFIDEMLKTQNVTVNDFEQGAKSSKT